jgi:hypothetical protein
LKAFYAGLQRQFRILPAHINRIILDASCLPYIVVSPFLAEKAIAAQQPLFGKDELSCLCFCQFGHVIVTKNYVLFEQA